MADHGAKRPPRNHRWLREHSEAGAVSPCGLRSWPFLHKPYSDQVGYEAFLNAVPARRALDAYREERAQRRCQMQILDGHRAHLRASRGRIGGVMADGGAAPTSRYQD